MLRYLSVEQAIRHPGLRIVLVQGMPSPWSQSAKTFFELKGLDYVAAPYVVGGTNDEVVAWSGQNSAPVVAWQDEPPIHRWIDILNLVERLAPEPALLPSDARERALVIGLSNEICGELGIGWNRRLEMFAAAMESGAPPEGIARMSAKYGYRRADAERAAVRTAASLRALAAQLHAQYERGVEFFVGDRLSALDVYWTAFANLLAPLPKEQCPCRRTGVPGSSPGTRGSSTRSTRSSFATATGSSASASGARWSSESAARAQRRASRIRLNGVSVARRKRVKPASRTTSRSRFSPACAPSAARPSWASEAGVQIIVEAE